jgi:serine/threonine-protein phosphatase CPPED1
MCKNNFTGFFLPGFALLFGLFPPALFAQVSISNGSENADNLLRIVQISDVQLGYTYARARQDSLKPDNSFIDTDKRYFESAVNCINKLSPRADVVVNTGDLVNDSENQNQWNDYLTVSDNIEAPLYEVMGNHEGWSASGVEKFKSRFKQNDFYSFTVKECQFIVLNSWYLKFPDQNPLAANEQKQFLTSVLQDHAASKFRVILMHFPVYLQSPDEQEAYFNLPPDQRKWLLDVALKNKVKIILTGHNHRNSQVTYNDSLSIITTGSVSKPLGMNSDSTPSVRGFRIIDINLGTGAVSQEFVPLDEEIL